jgi:hypothetical protein
MRKEKTGSYASQFWNTFQNWYPELDHNRFDSHVVIILQKKETKLTKRIQIQSRLRNGNDIKESWGMQTERSKRKVPETARIDRAMDFPTDVLQAIYTGIWYKWLT